MAGAILSHIDQCAAIAELESGEDVEDSLFAPPNGQSHVKPTLTLYKRDHWLPGIDTEDRGGNKKPKVMMEGSRKEGSGNQEEEGMARSAALDTLLSLKTVQCATGEAKLVNVENVDKKGNSDGEV